jgi:hypothetical protein
LPGNETASWRALLPLNYGELALNFGPRFGIEVFQGSFVTRVWTRAVGRRAARVGGIFKGRRERR